MLTLELEEETYKNIINKYTIGKDITVEFTINPGSSQIYYKVVG